MPDPIINWINRLAHIAIALCIVAVFVFFMKFWYGEYWAVYFTSGGIFVFYLMSAWDWRFVGITKK